MQRAIRSCTAAIEILDQEEPLWRKLVRLRIKSRKVHEWLVEIALGHGRCGDPVARIVKFERVPRRAT